MFIFYRTFCPLNFTDWPWGIQTCSFMFGSWTYSSKFIDIDINSIEIGHSNFINPQVPGPAAVGPAAQETVISKFTIEIIVAFYSN